MNKIKEIHFHFSSILCKKIHKLVNQENTDSPTRWVIVQKIKRNRHMTVPFYLLNDHSSGGGICIFLIDQFVNFFAKNWWKVEMDFFDFIHKCWQAWDKVVKLAQFNISNSGWADVHHMLISVFKICSLGWRLRKKFPSFFIENSTSEPTWKGAAFCWLTLTIRVHNSCDNDSKINVFAFRSIPDCCGNFAAFHWFWIHCRGKSFCSP